MLVDGIEYKIAIKTAEKTLYLESVYTNERLVGEIKEDGTIDFKLNHNRISTESNKALILEMMAWDDEDLFRARDSLLPVTTIWTDRMKCGHRVKEYEIFIDAGDNIVRVRFKCVMGCLTEWFEMDEIPLPHTHRLTVMKMEKA